MTLKQVVSLVLLVSLLTSILVTGISCGSSTSDGAAISMMKKLPGNMSSFMYIDVQAFRADDALEPALEDFIGETEDIKDSLGVDLEDLEGLVMAGMGQEEDTLMALSGSFDIAEVGKALEVTGFTKDAYKSVEVWEFLGYAVAVMTDTIIIGSQSDVNDCVDVIKEGASSLYANKDIRGIVGQLPDGIMLAVGEGSSVFQNAKYEGLERAGQSASKGSEGKISCMAIFEFGNKEAASAALDNVKANIEDEEGVTNVNVTQDGDIIEATLEQDAEEFFAS